MTKKNSNIIRIIFVTFFIPIVVLEVVLRFIFGFCDAPLYIESGKYEYIFAPNQDRHRFGRRIIYNEYSMRSLPLTEEDSIRVLWFGDSVLNGGTQTDHQDLATSIIENNLSSKYGSSIRMLNVSAGSWGPDNAAAYLEDKGDFSAKLMVLVFSSHDAFDNMTFNKVVGIEDSHPNKQYKVAIYELFERYLLPFLKGMFKDEFKENLMINTTAGTFNPGLYYLINYAECQNIPVIFYVHPILEERKQNTYFIGGNTIIDFINSRSYNIYLVKGLNYYFSEDMYRDHIHLNELGQEQLSKILEPFIIKALNKH